MSVSVVSCSRFKQNAWKKELCSNCYRPKEEHQLPVRTRPPQLFIPLKAPSQGILNLGGKNRSSTSPSKNSIKKKSVKFSKQEIEIIGFDGGDTDSEEEDDEDDSSTNSSGCDTDEYFTNGEEDKALERMTKSNTDFNSLLSNLSNENNSSTHNLQQLLLGAKQHKQTLQVSIQPFGASSTCSSIAASRKSHLHKLLEDEQPKQIPCTILSSSPNENDDPLLVQLKQQKEVKKIEENAGEEIEEIVEHKEVPIKTIFIESSRKEERGNPEGRKTQIQRGNVITKSHEQVKNKLYIQNIARKESRNSLLQDKTNENEDLKTLIIRTNSPDFEEKKNTLNLEDSQIKNEKTEDAVVVQPTKLKIESEVTVKVLKLLNGQDGPAESREMAGEPDGKADSDEPETPLTPPPRASFLHRDAIQQHHVPSPIASPVKLSPHTTPPLAVTPSTPTSPLSLALSSFSETKPSPPHSPSATSPSLPPSPQSYCEQSSLSGENSPNSDIPISPGSLLARCKRPAPKPPTPDLLQQQFLPKLPTLPPPPEPVPRQRRGSAETVLPTIIMAPTPGGTVSEKKKVRVRQTLRKLLRLGREDENCGNNNKEDDNHNHNTNQNQIQSHTRPRPHIIHPLDLNKSAVQVLPPQSIVSAEKSSPENASPSSTIFSPARPSKPPPPPRSESLNLMERLRPSPNSENNVYANLGEGRCGITPVKPQRTGSLRDQTSSIQLIKPILQLPLQTKICTMIQDTDHVYECVGVSSAPECDMERQRTSLQYSSAGSETESDIYYPYVTFQNGECKTKLKKRERGVVHSTLEENYGAVVVANYEALSHLLTQSKTRKPNITADLENFIKNPSWSLLENNPQHCLKIGSIIFMTTSFGKDCPDIVVAIKEQQEINLPSDLQPLVTFSDKIISTDNMFKDISERCNISVLGRLKLERINDYAERLERSAEAVREGVLVLLQVVEHMIVNSSRRLYDPNNFVVYIRHDETTPRATYISSNKITEDISKDVTETLQTLSKLLLADLPLCHVISNSKDACQVRSLLQTWLWGPTVSLAPQALHRWLDLERATFLHSIICNNIPFQDPAKDLQLKFLIETDLQEIAVATLHFTEATNNLAHSQNGDIV